MSRRDNNSKSRIQRRGEEGGDAPLTLEMTTPLRDEEVKDVEEDRGGESVDAELRRRQKIQDHRQHRCYPTRLCFPHS